MDELDPELPTAQPDVQSHEVHDNFAHDVAFRVGFVGVGQGGGRLAATFRSLGYGRVAAINTDHSDLSALPAEMAKLDLETGGAGKDPTKGAAAADGKEEEIYELLIRAIGSKPDYLLVCAGLGGGTGSGLSARVIAVARKFMTDHGRDPQRVGAIVTLPNPAEGQLPCRNAVTAFNEIAKLDVSPFFVMDNKRINEMFKTGVPSFYDVANNQIAKLFHMFNRLAAQRSPIITFDRADLASMLDSGLCVIGASSIASFESAADISKSIRQHLEATVLAPVDVKTGHRAACIFVGSREILDKTPMDFLDGGFTMLTRSLAEDSVVHRGVYLDEGKKLACYTMLGDLAAPKESIDRLAAQGRISQGGVSEHFGV